MNLVRSAIAVVALLVSVCAPVAAGVSLTPKWVVGQKLVYAGNSKIATTQEFHSLGQTVEMSTSTRSEVVWEVVEAGEDGGAVLDIRWNWMRAEMDSTTLVEPVVFDSREPEEAEGLVKDTFGPLVEMIEKPVRLRVDPEGRVEIVGQIVGETPEGRPKFSELAERSFTAESVRAFVRNMLVWVRPGEVEQGQSWATVLSGGERATCTLVEFKEEDGERFAVIRTQWAMEEDAPPIQQGPNGETIRTDFHRQSMNQLISLDSGRLVREEHIESTAIEGSTRDGKWDASQSATTITALLRTESVDEESELDLDRHAQGE